MEVRGRGEWHQIDALATPLYSLPFMYPLRLMIEAKCYDKARKVDVRIVRAAIGTALDVNQSYSRSGASEIDIQQFSYHGAIFSTSGYSADAQRLAAAHQVFLIDYTAVPAMNPVVDALLALRAVDFNGDARPDGNINVNLSDLRERFREALFQAERGDPRRWLQQQAGDQLVDLIARSRAIAGSYYGMVQGIYPVHLISLTPISPDVLLQWEIPVNLRVQRGAWFFEPSSYRPGNPRYFRLEFRLPTTIAEILQARVADEREVPWRTLVDLKRTYFSYIDIGGMIGNRFSFFRLTLDEDWLQRYTDRRRADDTSDR
jgi:hypothetical protein